MALQWKAHWWLDSGCYIALDLVLVDETTDHFKEASQVFTCCCSVADELYCRTFHSNGKQYNQEALGPAHLWIHSWSLCSWLCLQCFRRVGSHCTYKNYIPKQFFCLPNKQPTVTSSRLLLCHLLQQMWRTTSSQRTGRSGIFRFFLVASTYKQYRAEVRGRTFLHNLYSTTV